MCRLVNDMLEEKVWAVVGDCEEHKGRIKRVLEKKGHKVYCVHPKRENRIEEFSYAKLVNLPQKPDVVFFSAPPEVTGVVLEEALQQNVKNIWVQPGAGNSVTLEQLLKAGAQTTFNHCIIKEIRKKRLKDFLRTIMSFKEKIWR